jgi:hypothetical protein
MTTRYPTFGELKGGERFTFSGETEVFVKLGLTTYYREGGDPLVTFSSAPSRSVRFAGDGVMEDPQRILLEVTLKQPPARPDTPEEAAFRQKMVEQVAEIIARGGVVNIPSEWP